MADDNDYMYEFTLLGAAAAAISMRQFIRTVDGQIQGRINHCASCTMGGLSAAKGSPISCRIFTTTFERAVYA